MKYYVQVEPNDVGYLNVDTSEAECFKAVYLSDDEELGTTKTMFSVRKALKYLRLYSKNHDIDITKVKFIPVKHCDEIDEIEWQEF